MMAPSLRQRAALAFVAGAAQPLAFAPFGYWPVSGLSLAVLFALTYGRGWRQAGVFGFCFGVGAFAAGVHWVYVSLHTFGGMAAPLAGLMVAGFVLWLALFPALACATAAALPLISSSWRLLVLGPAAWVLCEWARGFGSLGFSWLALGYSQTESALAGWAPIVGVYGISFIVAYIAACVAACVLLSSWRVKLVAVAFAVVAGIAGAILNERQWSQPVGGAIEVGIAQGNIPITKKWQPGATEKAIAHYLGLTEKIGAARLIVWPESALTTFVDRLDQQFFDQLAAYDAVFLFGILERHQSDKQLVYHNSIMAAAADDRQLYRKQHLVPFGEYLPLRPLFAWVLTYLDIPMSDFLPWSEAQPPISIGNIKVGLSICYEDAFARDILPALPEANMLVNVSEDAWFGDSFGPHQRLQMAQMRSQETARPMVRVSNTGISGFIDAKGRLTARLPQFTAAAMSGRVQPVTGETPFVMFANLPVIAVCVAIILIVLITTRTKQRSPAPRKSPPHP